MLFANGRRKQKVKRKDNVPSGEVFAGKILTEVTMGREQRLNDIIDNEFLKKETTMSLSLKKVNGKTRRMRLKMVDRNADWLVRKLGSPESRPFYCKCALYLPWTRVVEFVELAMRPRITKHAAYFVRLAKMELDDLGVK